MGTGPATSVATDTDVLDELLVFVTYRPAWVNKEGFPLSWQHYLYGLRHIAREQLRQALLIAQAVRMGESDKESFDVFQRDTTRVTEVPHG